MLPLDLFIIYIYAVSQQVVPMSGADPGGCPGGLAPLFEKIKIAPVTSLPCTHRKPNFR